MFHRDGPSFWELARQALSSTERGYDLLAPKFDRTPFRTPDEVIAGALAFVPERVSAAIDLCCGTGAAARLLRTQADRVVGVDVSQGMLDEAARRGGEVEWVRADALDLPYRDEFELATCFGAFGHILPRDEPRLVRSVARALAPRGRFVFATAEHPPLLSPQHLVARAFNAAMHVRNLVWRPPFVMYYLTFLLPDCAELLEQSGFTVTVHHAAFPPPWHPLRVVVATRGARAP